MAKKKGKEQAQASGGEEIPPKVRKAWEKFERAEANKKKAFKEANNLVGGARAAHQEVMHRTTSVAGSAADQQAARDAKLADAEQTWQTWTDAEFEAAQQKKDAVDSLKKARKSYDKLMANVNQEELPFEGEASDEAAA